MTAGAGDDDGQGRSQAAASSPLQSMSPPDGCDAVPIAVEHLAEGPGECWNTLFGKTIVRNVSQPTLTPFLPDPADASGAAVVVLPGGGFRFLSIEDEGWAVARWLAAHGIAAFVLKYRLKETPADDTDFGRETAGLFAAAGEGGVNLDLDEPRATQDAAAAIGMVRANAAQWGVDPARVGMLGFSAGAITAMRAVIEGEVASRPAILGYIYGPMTGASVPVDAPPMFAALALDDPLFGGQGFGIVDAWRKAGRPVELHAYEAGGHGYGLGAEGTTAAGMMDQFLAWMRARGLLDRS